MTSLRLVPVFATGAASVACILSLFGSEQLPVPTHPNPEAGPTALSVLLIGDSNTEIGHVSGAVAKRFEQSFGYFGSGYRSLNAVIGMGSGYLPYLKISNGEGWKMLAMVQPGAPKPYMAPDGSYIASTRAGATSEVQFYGDSVLVYWLSDPAGGQFTAGIAGGGPSELIDTRSNARKLRVTELSGLTAGWHTLQLTAKSPGVTLLGVETKLGLKDGARRAVVHKWGKGWATSKDFTDIDAGIFQESLQAVKPDVTVIILGTNDHNLAAYNRDQFAGNIRTLVSRIKDAVPETRVLVLSTLQVNSPWSNNGLEEYLAVLPEICEEAGASYWNMSDWFGGPWSKNNEAGWMADNVHVNEAGGDRIGGQLTEEILRVAVFSPGAPQPKKREAGKLVGKAPVAETPVPGLNGWWSAAGEMEVDEDGGVISWKDASGNAADGVAPWPTSRPKLIEDPAVGRLLHFDGKASYLQFPMQEKVQSIFIVLRTNRLILGHPYFNTRPFNVGVVRPLKAFSANYASPELKDGQGFLNGGPVHLVDDRDDALQFNPQAFQVLAMIFKKPVPFAYLGWGGSWNFDRYMAGDVAEMRVYDRALSEEECQKVTIELMSRWGVK